jgi:hypothetical protein
MHGVKTCGRADIILPIYLGTAVPSPMINRIHHA